MQLTLTPHETTLLVQQLTQHIAHVDEELVHTDKRELQRDIAHELDELRALLERIRSVQGLTSVTSPHSVP
jgi:hypothetical protein